MLNENTEENYLDVIEHEDTEYKLHDTQARENITTIENKISENATPVNKLVDSNDVDARIKEVTDRIDTTVTPEDRAMPKSYFDKAINDLINDAPEEYDTLKEIATWISTYEAAKEVLEQGVDTQIVRLNKLTGLTKVGSSNDVDSCTISNTKYRTGEKVVYPDDSDKQASSIIKALQHLINALHPFVFDTKVPGVNDGTNAVYKTATDSYTANKTSSDKLATCKAVNNALHTSNEIPFTSLESIPLTGEFDGNTLFLYGITKIDVEE